jgi:hypothetical protein
MNKMQINDATSYITQQGNKATRQQGNKATRQQGNKATRQQGNKATRQQGMSAGSNTSCIKDVTQL